MKKVDKVKYAVLVDCGKAYRFVTGIEGKNAAWCPGDLALLFSSKSYAQDIATGLCANGIPAMVVLIPEYLTNICNK